MARTDARATHEIETMGYKILLYPVTALLAVTRTLESVSRRLLGDESLSPQDRASFRHYNDIVGLADWERFAADCEKGA